MKFKKLILVNFLVSVLALFVATLLVGFIGSGEIETASAAGMAPRVITLTPTITITPTEPPEPKWVCLRFNFEIGADAEDGSLPGHFEMVIAQDGKVISTWKPEPGSTDSGWIEIPNIPFDAIHVEVRFYPEGSAQYILMTILNPAPSTPYGWLARGVCHAIEIEYPVAYRDSGVWRTAALTPNETPVVVASRTPQSGASASSQAAASRPDTSVEESVARWEKVEFQFPPGWYYFSVRSPK